MIKHISENGRYIVSESLGIEVHFTLTANDKYTRKKIAKNLKLREGWLRGKTRKININSILL